jgi:hypothetical protein
MILDHVAYAEDVLSGFIAALYESGLDLPPQGKVKVEEVAASFICGLPETSDDDARAATRDADFWTLERRRQWAEERMHALAVPSLSMPHRAPATMEAATAQVAAAAGDALESWLWRVQCPYAPALHATSLKIGDDPEKMIRIPLIGARELDRGELDRLERLATVAPATAPPGATIDPVRTTVELSMADGSVRSVQLEVNHVGTATFADDPERKSALVRTPLLSSVFCFVLHLTIPCTRAQNAVMRPVVVDEELGLKRTFYWGTTGHLMARLCFGNGAHLLLGSGHAKTLHQLGFYFSKVTVDFWACGSTCAQVEAAAIKVCSVQLSLCSSLCPALLSLTT